MRGLHAITATINLGCALVIYLLPVAGRLHSFTVGVFLAIGALYLRQAVRGRKR